PCSADPQSPAVILAMWIAQPFSLRRRVSVPAQRNSASSGWARMASATAFMRKARRIGPPRRAAATTARVPCCRSLPLWRPGVYGTLMLAARVQHFTESVIRETTRLAQQHGALNLGQGMPEFDPPDEVKEAACR